ncbi:hypothetical protein SAMN05428967_2957 [Phyllobacterium sp. YR620]|uniref:hypothetical protein n=1 Tax=Phyllobacterium sp. YR620 TaxID=1881066 RepID=UPI00088A78B5|nr:hypothetical protein [Phyllobacterium sp. YR620]SDP67988.1 hypothetical protein SAMN05428967_2957 [Phyllobacterium sp. YR620]
MKIFFLMRIFWRSAVAKRERGDGEILDWQRDPLSHPVLDAMCLDELADLPFDARSVSRQ